MKEPSKTREKILDAAYDLFYSHGYHATGLNAILERAGVQKGSLYHFFNSKKTLALAVIDEHISERFKAKYLPLQHSEKPLSTLLVFLSNPENFDLRRGCPLGKLVQELSNADEDFREALARVYGSYEGYIQQILDLAMQKGELRSCDTAKLATFITSVIAGAIQRARLGNSETFFTDTVEVLKNCLQPLD